MESKIPQCMIDYLISDFGEQMNPIRLKNKCLHKKEGCFVKDINERDIIYKYLLKLDHDFLLALNHIDDFFGFDKSKHVLIVASFSSEGL